MITTNNAKFLNFSKIIKYSELDVGQIKKLLSIEIKKKNNAQNISKKNLLRELLIEKIKNGEDVFDFTIAKGFQNPTATTCYANSLLQLFLSCTELVKEVMKIEPETEFIIKLKELICDYYFKPSEEINASILESFLNILGCEGEQSTINEYLTSFFNRIKNIDSINRENTSNKIHTNIYNLFRVRSINNTEYNEGSKLSSNSAIRGDYNNILFLPIPIGGNISAQTINFQKIWDSYFQVERIQEAKNTTKFLNITTSLGSDSKYLFIFLRRTSFDFHIKQNVTILTAINKIWMKKTLEISEYREENKDGQIILIETGKKKVTYRLIAFSTFSGDSKSGHYFSFKKAGEQWYLMNDMDRLKCRQIGTQDPIFIKSLKQSVLLVYEKVEGVNNTPNILFNNSLSNNTSNRRNTRKFNNDKLRNFLIFSIIHIYKTYLSNKNISEIGRLLYTLNIKDLKEHLKGALSEIKNNIDKIQILIRIILTLKKEKYKLDEEVIPFFIEDLIQYNSKRLENILFEELSESNNSTKKSNGSFNKNKFLKSAEMRRVISEKDPNFFKNFSNKSTQFIPTKNLIKYRSLDEITKKYNEIINRERINRERMKRELIKEIIGEREVSEEVKKTLNDKTIDDLKYIKEKYNITNIGILFNQYNKGIHNYEKSNNWY
jgi:hypothetical protein